MRFLAPSLLTAAILSLVAGTAAAEEAKKHVPPSDDGWVRGRLVTVPMAPPDDAAAVGDISNILYINRCVGGCTVFSSESNNALTDESTIAPGSSGSASTITEFGHPDAVWEQLMECLRETYAPYNVIVTDEDPGQTPHHENIAAGAPQELSLSDGIGGIAPSGCDPRNNVISYAFLNTYPASQVLEMCATVAQESAHSFGLPNHAYDCTDPMTYLGGCGQKFFRNKLMKCGEFAEAPCNCTGTRVNSHVQLLAAFGEGTLPPPPTVAVTYPAAGAVISDTVIVQVAADDKRGVYKVELYLNGWLWDTYILPEDDPVPPANFVLDPDGEFPDGTIDIVAIAYNDLGVNATSSAVTVTKGSPCSSADSCLDGQLCEEGRCFWEAPSTPQGEPCTFSEQCVGPNTYDGRCESDGSQNLCTRDCYTGVNDDCEAGSFCLETNAAEGTGVCWPEGEDTGCCSTGNGSGTFVSQLLLLGVVGGLALRRRRRSV